MDSYLINHRHKNQFQNQSCFQINNLVIGCIFGEKSDEVKYIFPALVFILLTDPSQESSVTSLALGNTSHFIQLGKN